MLTESVDEVLRVWTGLRRLISRAIVSELSTWMQWDTFQHPRTTMTVQSTSSTVHYTEHMEL